MTSRELVLTAILVILISVGLIPIKKLLEPVQAEPDVKVEPIEMTVAKLFVKSGLKYDCYQFMRVWKSLFPDANCYRKQIGAYGHWVCDLNDKLLIDANYGLDKLIRIREK